MHSQKKSFYFPQVIENDHVRYWKEGEILVQEYKKGALIGLDAARQMVALRKKHFPGPQRCMIYIHDVAAGSPEAKEYLAGRESVENILKGAFIIKNPITAIFVSAFLKINRPPLPAKVFTRKEDAIQWLLK